MGRSPGASIRVLIADDERDAAERWARVLRKSGIAVPAICHSITAFDAAPSVRASIEQTTGASNAGGARMTLRMLGRRRCRVATAPIRMPTRGRRQSVSARCLVPLLAIFAAGSCGRRSSRWPLDHLADGTLAISHAALHPQYPEPRLLISDPMIGDPRHLEVQGDRLWIADDKGDPYLDVVNIATGKILVSFGRHGEGPGDFGNVPQFSRRPGDNEGIWAYDDGLKRTTRETGESTGKYTIFHPPSDFVGIFAYLWLSHDRLVGIGDMDSNRVVIADTNGRLLALREADLLGGDSVPLLARRAASLGFVACADPATARFAVLYQLGGRIDLFDSTGSLLTHATVPFASNGDWAFSPRHNGLWAQPDWFFYIDCDATSRYLYALFAGHRTDGPHGGRVRAARYVHVFDWDGRLVRVIGLGRETSTIAVAGDTLLYAAGQDGEGVFEYRLAGPP